MRRCPTCGQPVTSALDEESALLALLTTGKPHRQVYRGKDTNQWFVTYGGGEFSAAAVRQLIKRGDIASCYNDCPEDAYHVGRTVDCERSMAARKACGRQSALVYVGDP